MASLIRSGSGKVKSYAVQYRDPRNDRRPIIRLGKVGTEAAREFKTKVEALLGCVIANRSPDTQLETWLSGLTGNSHEKIAAMGLTSPRVPPPTAPTLRAWADKYIGQRADLKPSSRTRLEQTIGELCEFFGESKSIDAIGLGEAADWRTWLAGKPRKYLRRADGKTAITDTRLSDGTVRVHCRNAKTLFREAAERELIGQNPFRKLASQPVAAERDRYLTPDEAGRLIEAAPSVSWKALLGLCRYAGLRCPSETHKLTWQDLDFAKGHMRVRSPKTERFRGHAERTVPVVPKLAALLQDAFDDAAEGETRVVSLGRKNLHRGVEAICKRAEIEPFARPFQVLRQSAETEFAMKFPAHVAAAWLGHSERVSKDHYLLIPAECWQQAAGLGETPSEGAAKSAAKSAAADSGIERRGAAEPISVSDVSHTENPGKQGGNGDSETGGGGIRTHEITDLQSVCSVAPCGRRVRFARRRLAFRPSMVHNDTLPCAAFPRLARATTTRRAARP